MSERTDLEREMIDELNELRERMELAANLMPDPMHPNFPSEWVDRQVDALALLSDDDEVAEAVLASNRESEQDA